MVRLYCGDIPARAAVQPTTCACIIYSPLKYFAVIFICQTNLCPVLIWTDWTLLKLYKLHNLPKISIIMILFEKNNPMMWSGQGLRETGLEPESHLTQ